MTAAATTAAAADAIAIDGLCMRYDATPALEDITLAVRQRETFGLMGRHGAGKTSLLKAILMLATPQAGTVRIFGEPHHLPASRARLAYLPQRFQPPGHLSGHDFVRLTFAFHGWRAKRAETALLAEQLALDPGALDRPIRSYAKGMVQKLGLLATLLTDLPLLVLDEPMSGLDPAARRLVKRQLVADRDRGRTILLSSYLPSDHEELCDRVAVLDQGLLRYVGAPDDLEGRHGAPTLTSAFAAAIEESRLLGAAAGDPA
jgi:ABC-2 type transport system ATP-binding protein